MYKRVSILILLLLVTGISWAQPVQRPAGPRVLAAYLQLTPDQVAAWKQMHSDTAAAVKPLVANAMDLRKQLRAALEATPPDPATIGKLAIALHAARNQVRDARQTSKTKLLALLTPEQKTKFAAFEAAASFIRQPRRSPGT